MSCAEGTPNRQVNMYRYLLLRRMANFSSRPWSDGTWSTIYPSTVIRRRSKVCLFLNRLAAQIVVTLRIGRMRAELSQLENPIPVSC